MFTTYADMSRRLTSKTFMSRTVGDSETDDPHTQMVNKEEAIELTAAKRKNDCFSLLEGDCCNPITV